MQEDEDDEEKKEPRNTLPNQKEAVKAAQNDYQVSKLVSDYTNIIENTLNLIILGLYLLMTVKKFLGVSFTSLPQLLLILLQLLCYANSFYVTIILLGPLPFLPILFLIFSYSRAATAFYYANSTHQPCSTKPPGRYCRSCEGLIEGRDHHCIFTGRCVEKANYRYFFSYLIYSYGLSVNTARTVIEYWELMIDLWNYKAVELAFMLAALISSIYFLIFTGLLLAGSIRSIFLGIYSVEELKKEKKAEYSNWEMARLWFSSAGRRTLLSKFRQNWLKMAGEEGLLAILLVL